ncbi:MAG: ATP-binding cassette domain-containing protein, partial [Planctomycetota bacterium]
MLRATGITKSFPGVKALEDVDFEVYSGEIHALVGENGAGKSTLVKILGGALRPDAGTASLAGQPLPFGDPVRTRALGVGIIYQELALVPELSAAENIFLGREWSRTGMLSRSRMAESVAD